MSSTILPHHKGVTGLKLQILGGADRGSWRCPQDRRPLPSTSEGFSNAHHASHARVHLILFKKLATCDLIDAQLHLCVEPILLSEQTVDGLRGQFSRAASSACGKAGECRRLTFGKLKAHEQKLGGARPAVKVRPAHSPQKVIVSRRVSAARGGTSVANPHSVLDFCLAHKGAPGPRKGLEVHLHSQPVFAN
jgi:hypothetical protein